MASLVILVVATGSAVVVATTGANGNDPVRARVVVVGDSLVVGSESQLSAAFAADRIDSRFIAVGGTGLLTDQGVRVTELDQMLDQSPADLVIIESCCNYDGTFRTVDGHVVAPDTDELWAAWADQSQRIVDVATRHGARVAVVLTPRAIPGTWFGGLQDRITHFNDIYRGLGVPLIDWDTALYPDGTVAGREDLRMPDGLHLSAAGAELVAATTGKAVVGLVG